MSVFFYPSKVFLDKIVDKSFIYYKEKLHLYPEPLQQWLAYLYKSSKRMPQNKWNEFPCFEAFF